MQTSEQLERRQAAVSADAKRTASQTTPPKRKATTETTTCSSLHQDPNKKIKTTHPCAHLSGSDSSSELSPAPASDADDSGTLDNLKVLTPEQAHLYALIKKRDQIAARFDAVKEAEEAQEAAALARELRADTSTRRAEARWAGHTDQRFNEPVGKTAAYRKFRNGPEMAFTQRDDEPGIKRLIAGLNRRLGRDTTHSSRRAVKPRGDEASNKTISTIRISSRKKTFLKSISEPLTIGEIKNINEGGIDGGQIKSAVHKQELVPTKINSITGLPMHDFESRDSTNDFRTKYYPLASKTSRSQDPINQWISRRQSTVALTADDETQSSVKEQEDEEHEDE